MGNGTKSGKNVIKKCIQNMFKNKTSLAKNLQMLFNGGGRGAPQNFITDF